MHALRRLVDAATCGFADGRNMIMGVNGEDAAAHSSAAIACFQVTSFLLSRSLDEQNWTITHDGHFITERSPCFGEVVWIDTMR